MNMRYLHLFTVIWLATVPSFAGAVYSYVDEEGVMVFSNLGGERNPATIAEASPGQSRTRSNFIPLITQFSNQYGVDEDLVTAIIRVESDFDPNAVSTKECKGLMQLHPATASRFGVRNIFDPADNIEGGIKFLTYLMDAFDNRIDYVLAAYNAGENVVRRYGGIPPYQETIGYVKRVKSLYQRAFDARNAARNRKNRVLRIEAPGGQVLFTNLQ
jgi:soluble lytic murein transglycosylase